MWPRAPFCDSPKFFDFIIDNANVLRAGFEEVTCKFHSNSILGAELSQFAGKSAGANDVSAEHCSVAAHAVRFPIPAWIIHKKTGVSHNGLVENSLPQCLEIQCVFSNPTRQRGPFLNFPHLRFGL